MKEYSAAGAKTKGRRETKQMHSRTREKETKSRKKRLQDRIIFRGAH